MSKRNALGERRLREVDQAKRLGRGPAEPDEEAPGVEEHAPRAGLVVDGVGQQHEVGGLAVEERVEDDGQGGVGDVEQLVVDRFVERLARQVVVQAEPELRHAQHHVLEEVVQDQRRVLAVAFAAVEEQQPLQHAELPDRKVCRTRRLLALEPLDADAHVRLGDHVHVVRAVPDAQRYRFGTLRQASLRMP